MRRVEKVQPLNSGKSTTEAAKTKCQKMKSKKEERQDFQQILTKAMQMNETDSIIQKDQKESECKRDER